MKVRPFQQKLFVVSTAISFVVFVLLVAINASNLVVAWFIMVPDGNLRYQVGFVAGHMEVTGHKAIPDEPMFRFACRWSPGHPFSIQEWHRRKVEVDPRFDQWYPPPGPAGFHMDVPDWPAIVVSGIIPLIWRVRLRRRVWRLQHGLCEHCGYKLFGSRGSVCPECGTPLPESFLASRESPEVPLAADALKDLNNASPRNPA